MLSLLAEMNALADKLAWTPTHHRDALQIEFFVLQAHRAPGLSDAERRDLFSVWCDQYEGRQRLRDAERNSRAEALCEEQRKLLIARQLGGADAAAITERLYQIGLEMAALVTPPEYRGPLATFGTED